MSDFNKLKKEGLKAAAFRGHKMENWGFTVKAGGSGIRGGAVCSKCGRGVQYDTAPPPNGIDIGGEAVALNCDVETIRIN
jgi:hypothetical protein